MGKKLIIGAVALVVVLFVAGGAFAVWYFVIDDDGPEKVTSECDPAPCEASTVDTLDGTWTVVADQSTASLAITETIGGIADHTAQGELTGVSGTVTVAGTQVTDADVAVDMTTLVFTDSPPGANPANRANAMKSQGLETESFTEATFVLSAPIELGDDLGSGQTATAEATGDLTLHGVSQPLTFSVDITADGDTFRVTPSEFIPIVLEDYGITVNGPAFVADISDSGTFDFLLVLQKG